MGRFLSLIRKDVLLLVRDKHGLLLLFAMPVLFILIMTFALQNQYGGRGATQLAYFLVDRSAGEPGAAFAEALAASPQLQRREEGLSAPRLRELVARDRVRFMVTLPPDFAQRLQSRAPALELMFAPGTTGAMAQTIESLMQALLTRFYLQHQFGAMSGETVTGMEPGSLMETRFLYGEEGETPTSVQQNVPAWLLFAMFFIAVPLSTTLINERRQGTLQRLHSMGVTSGQLLVSKLVPYVLVNLVQAVLLFLVGLYLVPALGGDRLTLGSHPEGLVVVTVAASLAAVCWGLLVAQLAATVEQATIVAAVANIIMAALGGVMVPRFIMPETMQALSALSPMAWGLEGFLDILLRDGDVVDVLPATGKLLVFAALAGVLSARVGRGAKQNR